jgi:hypothetical protein
MMNSIGGTAPIWASYLYVDGPHYYVAFGCCRYPFPSYLS